jgi:hypothetical protein
MMCTWDIEYDVKPPIHAAYHTTPENAQKNDQIKPKQKVLDHQN